MAVVALEDHSESLKQIESLPQMPLSPVPLPLGVALSRDTLEESLFETASQCCTILTCVISRLPPPEVESSRVRSGHTPYDEAWHF